MVAMSAGFRGASAGQDARFSNKEKKLLKTMKFPEDLDKPVDFKKVKLECMKPWIAKRVTELLGFEDEVVENLVQNLVSAPEAPSLRSGLVSPRANFAPSVVVVSL